MGIFDRLKNIFKVMIFAFIGTLFGKLGVPEKALKYYSKCSEIYPQHTHILSLQGLCLCELGMFEKGIEYYDKIIEIEPTNFKALSDKGAALFYLKRYEEAIRCYDKALEIFPNYEIAINNKANAKLYAESNCKNFVNMGVSIARESITNLSLAENYFNDALEANPECTYALINKAVKLSKIGEHKKANECYDKVLNINPNDKVAWAYKGLNFLMLEEGLDNERKDDYDEIGRYKETVKCYEKALEIDPKYTWCLANRENAIRNLKKLESGGKIRGLTTILTYHEEFIDH